MKWERISNPNSERRVNVAEAWSPNELGKPLVVAFEPTMIYFLAGASHAKEPFTVLALCENFPRIRVTQDDPSGTQCVHATDSSSYRTVKRRTKL